MPTAALYEAAIRRNEGTVAHMGPLVVNTGLHTGRSATDKFIVKDPLNGSHIWWGNVNQPIPPERFDEIQRRLATYLQSKDVFVQDCWAGADEDYRLPIRTITEFAWHSLFARNMFIQAKANELTTHNPQFTVIGCPGFRAIPEADETNSGVFVLMNFAKILVLIGGTSYAGEIKKSIFIALNYLLPFNDILPMHCSANFGSYEDVALFFGLSGTIPPLIARSLCRIIGPKN
ncbi:MAG: phosphoenolpyruvate carboxykinase (ATP) [Chloroflexota bacterium]